MKEPDSNKSRTDMSSDVFVQILLDTLDVFGLRTERLCSHAFSDFSARVAKY